MSQPAPANQLTIREAFEMYYLSHSVDLARMTIRRYRIEISRWERFMENPSLGAITTQTFNDYRRKCLDAGLSRQTAESGVRIVIQVLRHMGPATEIAPHGIGLIDKVPYRGKTMRMPQKMPVMPSADQVGMMYAKADVTSWPGNLEYSSATFWRAFLVLAYFTGARLGDLLTAVMWPNVRGDSISFIASKTGKLHMLPMHSVLWNHLETVRPRNGDWSGRVLPCGKSPERIRRELSKMHLAAGIPPLGTEPRSRYVNAKMLRRLAGTMHSAVNGSGPVLLGHSLGVSDLYIGVPNVLKEASERLYVPTQFLPPESMSKSA